MTEEIKEILDFLLYNDKLTTSGKRKLRDYITNLQQENILLKHNCKQAENSCRQHRLASKNHIRRLQRREKQIEDYKSRIEKAVEYIKRFDLIIGYYDYNDEGYYEIGENNNLQEELLNILNGRSDE